MPGNHHISGATPKENRQYEEILKSESARDLSIKTAKKIAAATVNKERARRGETKSKKSGK